MACRTDEGQIIQDLDREEARMVKDTVTYGRVTAMGSRGIFADVDAMRAALPNDTPYYEAMTLLFTTSKVYSSQTRRTKSAAPGRTAPG